MNETELETCEHCGATGKAVPGKILGWHDVAICAWTQVVALKERVEKLEKDKLARDLDVSTIQA